MEANPQAEEIGPLATLFLLTETERSPAVFLGTSSDRIGSPAGEQSYYATASKYVPIVRSSAYVTLNYSEWDEGFNVPFGVGLELGRGAATRYMYDGERSHALLTITGESIGVSLMYVWLEQVGLALHGGF